MTGPRDWDKEMAEIDKVIASGGAPQAPRIAAPPSRELQPRSSAVDTRGSAPLTRRRDTFGVWFRAVLGVGGVVALQLWPYARGCGTMLYLYMACTAIVALLGVWTMRGSWTHRRGVAHVAGVVVFIAGLSLAAIQILERTGYSAVRLGWTCP